MNRNTWKSLFAILAITLITACGESLTPTKVEQLTPTVARAKVELALENKAATVQAPDTLKTSWITVCPGMSNSSGIVVFAVAKSDSTDDVGTYYANETRTSAKNAALVDLSGRDYSYRENSVETTLIGSSAGMKVKDTNYRVQSRQLVEERVVRRVIRMQFTSPTDPAADTAESVLSQWCKK